MKCYQTYTNSIYRTKQIFHNSAVAGETWKTTRIYYTTLFRYFTKLSRHHLTLSNLCSIERCTSAQIIIVYRKYFGLTQLVIDIHSDNFELSQFDLRNCRLSSFHNTNTLTYRCRRFSRDLLVKDHQIQEDNTRILQSDELTLIGI